MDTLAEITAFVDAIDDQTRRMVLCKCCRQRLLHRFPNAAMRDVIEAVEKRGYAGPDDDPNLLRVREQADAEYQRVYPGFGAPSGLALALSAVGSAAFTLSARDAAISGFGFLVRAIATDRAESAGDDEYDTVYDTVLRDELAEVLAMLQAELSSDL